MRKILQFFLIVLFALSASTMNASVREIRVLDNYQYLSSEEKIESLQKMIKELKERIFFLITLEEEKESLFGKNVPEYFTYKGEDFYFWVDNSEVIDFDLYFNAKSIVMSDSEVGIAYTMSADVYYHTNRSDLVDNSEYHKIEGMYYFEDLIAFYEEKLNINIDLYNNSKIKIINIVKDRSEYQVSEIDVSIFPVLSIINYSSAHEEQAWNDLKYYTYTDIKDNHYKVNIPSDWHSFYWTNPSSQRQNFLIVPYGEKDEYHSFFLMDNFHITEDPLGRGINREKIQWDVFNMEKEYIEAYDATIIGREIREDEVVGDFILSSYLSYQDPNLKKTRYEKWVNILTEERLHTFIIRMMEEDKDYLEPIFDEILNSYIPLK